MSKRKTAKAPIPTLAVSPPVPLVVTSPRPLMAGRDGSSEAIASATPSEDTLRECLIQASENARAYMDLRFKHFGTFVVLSGLLGTAAFQVDGLSAIRTSLAGVSVALTLLFWLLDFRTSQYLADELHRIRTFKQHLAVPGTNCPSRFVLIRASHTTNLIFLAVVVLWCIIFLHFLSAA